MTKGLLLLLLFASFSLASLSQTDSAKECRIAAGIGFAGATNNSKAVGGEVWLQLDYNLSKKISIAMEFENMTYMLQGYDRTLPEDLDGTNVVSNNFSLLFKYHFETKLPLKFAVAGGWTYTLKTSHYYYYENSVTQNLSMYVWTVNDYEIPLLLEVRYPIWKALDVQARVKCNLNTERQTNYSSGIALSLRL